MDNSDIVKKMLMALGAQEQDTEVIIKDINEIIIAKITAAYFSRADGEIKDKLKSLSEEEIKQYFEDNKEKLPQPLSKEEIEEIVKETWKDYFKTMSSPDSTK